MSVLCSAVMQIPPTLSRQEEIGSLSGASPVPMVYFMEDFPLEQSSDNTVKLGFG